MVKIGHDLWRVLAAECRTAEEHTGVVDAVLIAESVPDIMHHYRLLLVNPLILIEGQPLSFLLLYLLACRILLPTRVARTIQELILVVWALIHMILFRKSRPVRCLHVVFDVETTLIHLIRQSTLKLLVKSGGNDSSMDILPSLSIGRLLRPQLR